jgi:hypothetical protein
MTSAAVVPSTILFRSFCVEMQRSEQWRETLKILVRGKT